MLSQRFQLYLLFFKKQIRRNLIYVKIDKYNNLERIVVRLVFKQVQMKVVNMAETISRNDVAHVASLAKLAFDEAKLDQFTDQLTDILTLFETLSEVDTSAVEPTYSVTPNVNHLREDIADNWHQKQELLANAPEEAADLIKVPAIIKGEDA